MSSTPQDERSLLLNQMTCQIESGIGSSYWSISQDLWIKPNVNVITIGQKAPARRKGEKGQSSGAILRQMLMADRIEKIFILRIFTSPDKPAVASRSGRDTHAVQRKRMNRAQGDPHLTARQRRLKRSAVSHTQFTLTLDRAVAHISTHVRNHTRRPRGVTP